MPSPSDLEQEAIATVRAFLETWATPGQVAAEHALAFIAEDFSGIGTGASERIRDREEIGVIFERERAQMPEAPVSFDLTWWEARLLRPDLALVVVQVRSEVIAGEGSHLIEPRSSYVLERVGDRWLIAHMHFSMPDASHEEGDTLRQALERRTRVLEREVAERTAELEQSLRDLKAAQAQLVQSEKMASLGQLTAGIAHEIKNPLNFVTNFASLSQELVDELEEETDPEEREALLADLKENAAKIEEHGRRADAIVRAMMAHARSGRVSRRGVAVNDLVEENAEHARHAFTVRYPLAEATLSVRLGEDVGEVEVAPQEIGRVVINLVDNALGAVRQRAEAEPDGYEPLVTVSTRVTGAGVEISVADNGFGMSEAVRAKVFEPFFTTKPTGEGTGLGLSLSHDIVVQGYGGTLTVESEEGAGATFTAVVPAAAL